MTQIKRQKNLTTGALLPQILIYALPMMATSILQHLFNTADMIVVGRWGGDTAEECAIALAAVGSCSSLINLFVNCFIGFSTGAGICVAHDIGAGHEDEVHKTVHTAITISFIVGAIVTMLGMFASGPVLYLMGTDATVLPQATAYMRAYFCGIPALMLYNFCASILRSKGDTVRPMIFLTIGGATNALFNLFAVIVLRWGAVGVGAATALSQWVACLLVVIYMLRMDGPCRLQPRALRIHVHSLKRIVTIALPAGFNSIFFALSNMAIQTAVNEFGPTVVAGNTAGSNLDNYIYSCQNAFYHASMTFVAQNKGAQKPDRIKKSIFYSSLSSVSVGFTVGLIFWIFAPSLLTIYAPDNPAVVDAGYTRMTILCLTYFLCGLMEIGTGALRGMGKSMLPTIVTLIGTCALRVIWSLVLISWLIPVLPTTTGLILLYVAYPVTWLITSATQFILCAVVLRKYKRKLETEAQPI